MLNTSNYKQIVSTIMIVVVSNLGVFIISKSDAEINVSKGVFAGTMLAWTKSQSFLDEVYTFNVDGIGGRIESLIDLYAETQSQLSICISIEIVSFSSEDREARSYCSEGKTIYSLTSDSGADVLSGREELKIGLKNMGHFSWYVANTKSVPFYQRGSISPLFILVLTLVEVLIISYLISIARRTLEVSKASPPVSSEQIKLLALQQSRLANIGKIIDRNKRVFAINKDLLYAEYEHPYTNTVYTNGKKERLRCSLAELKNSFSLDLVRLNRSTLVNSTLIREFGEIQTKKDKKSYLLVLQVKSKSVELEIGKQSETTLLKVFS